MHIITRLDRKIYFSAFFPDIVEFPDYIDYKNSIITFMKIDDKDWKRLLKNNKYFTNEKI